MDGKRFFALTQEREEEEGYSRITLENILYVQRTSFVRLKIYEIEIRIVL